MPSPPVTVAEFARMTQALEKLGFAPDDEEYLSAVDAFGEMLERLTPTERTLIISLAHDFLVCHGTEYFSQLIELSRKIDSGIVGGCQQVIILPLSETKKSGQPKSPSALHYYAVQRFKFVPALGGKSVRAFEKLDLVATEIPRRPQTLFVFLDDYIGSGDTAIQTVDRFRATVAKAGDRILILALVAQRAGLDRLTALDVPFLVKHIRDRGISDSGTFADRAAALATMDALESRLAVDADYRRGYRETEALVKMIRSPNNTFPVFWWTKATNGAKKWPGPFPRI